ASLVIFGLILSGIIWFLTRHMNAPEIPVARPKRESLGLLAYLAIYAFLLIGIWLGTVRNAVPEGPNQEWAVLAYKLLIHVGLPLAVILMLGGAVRPLFDSGIHRRGFWPTLIVLSALMFGLLALVSPSLSQIGALNLAPATALLWVLASWAWLSLEAGLCEEFLFRACLQSRLAAWLKTPVAAIALTSILFALSHWPGLYLRGGPGVDGWSTDPIQVAAFTIATLSPLSVALGLLWARSRSLLLVVLVHGAIDALPHTAETFRIWS
ncbi:MAG TPA: CPBP family intramembrane glutamic endopeptidase, partial [Sphingomicrobium sp.]|nr:CPBP family intramembrane glutamic endopeptidase [Sphingomicrobium sp.]